MGSIVDFIIGAITASISANHRDTPWEDSWLKVGLLTIFAIALGAAVGITLQTIV